MIDQSGSNKAAKRWGANTSGTVLCIGCVTNSRCGVYFSFSRSLDAPLISSLRLACFSQEGDQQKSREDFFPGRIRHRIDIPQRKESPMKFRVQLVVCTKESEAATS